MPETKPKEWATVPEGYWRVAVLAQALGESKEKKTPQLALKVELKQLKKATDGKTHQVKPGEHRTVMFYLTPNTIERVKGFLQEHGFAKGNSLAQLDPKHPKHFSLVGVEFDAKNKHEKGLKDGKPRDKFEAAGSSNQKWMESLGGGVSQTKLMALDAIFGTAPDYSVTKPSVKQEVVAGEGQPFGPEPTEESDASDFGW